MLKANCGQDRVVVTCPHCSDKDMGLNRTAIRKERNGHWGDSPTEDRPIVQQDLSGRPAISSWTRPVEKTEKKEMKNTALTLIYENIIDYDIRCRN